jgi:hypothetical protein
MPSGATRDTYTLGGDSLLVTSKDSGKTSSVPLPTSFPSFSWPTGVAHDTDLDIVSVVTMGGEGYLYRYDVRQRRWLDHRSMRGIDIKSLAYDVQGKRYEARTSDGIVLLISNQGELLDSKQPLARPGATQHVAALALGTPASPVNDRQLPLLQQAPPRELAADAELIVVSGYEPSAGVTRVLLNRPGKRVLLVLSSYEKILWRIEPSAGTTITGIVLASLRGGSGVIADRPVPVHVAELPYAYETDNINFRQMLQQLNAWFGVTKVDVLRGRYQVSSIDEISTLDPVRADLSLQGVAPTSPTSVFAFELLTRDLRKVSFRNDGTSKGPQRGQNLFADNKIAVSGSGRQVYTLSDAGLHMADTQSGWKALLPLPSQFPAFSWATAVAYDSDLDIVTVVTLGGEGFLYRYDAKRGQWLDYRSLNNVDITSLSYDTQARRYAGWSTNGELLFISGKGEPLGSKALKAQLLGFGTLYDGGNARMPSLMLAPRGSQLALVYVRDGDASMIWTYDEKTGQAQLTYKRAAVDDRQGAAR